MENMHIDVGMSRVKGKKSGDWRKERILSLLFSKRQTKLEKLAYSCSNTHVWFCLFKKQYSFAYRL